MLMSPVRRRLETVAQRFTDREAAPSKAACDCGETATIFHVPHLFCTACLMRAVERDLDDLAAYPNRIAHIVTVDEGSNWRVAAIDACGNVSLHLGLTNDQMGAHEVVEAVQARLRVARG